MPIRLVFLRLLLYTYNGFFFIDGCLLIVVEISLLRIGMLGYAVEGDTKWAGVCYGFL